MRRLFLRVDINGVRARELVALLPFRRFAVLHAFLEALHRAAQIGADLATAGVIVVSGLAPGVSGAVHEGAVAGWTASGSNGAPPVAVVGGGLDDPRPRRHIGLWERVAESGAILSERPIGTAELPWRLMERNRIMAGLADVLVVVDYSRKTEVSVNALAALNVFIVPALFLPFRDVKVESAVDAFVVDVRNGYVYGHVALSQEASKPHQTIYSDDDALARDEWKALQNDLGGALVKLAEVERATKSHT